MDIKEIKSMRIRWLKMGSTGGSAKRLSCSQEDFVIIVDAALG
jgi:hypothetical protein